MNILLKKILINLSILVFVATFFISLHVGTPIIECFLRGSIALLVVAAIGRFVLINFFKDVAIQMAKDERQKEQQRQKKPENSDNYDNYDDGYNDEEDSKTSSIIDNPFADNVATEAESKEQDII